MKKLLISSIIFAGLFNIAGANVFTTTGPFFLDATQDNTPDCVATVSIDESGSDIRLVDLESKKAIYTFRSVNQGQWSAPFQYKAEMVDAVGEAIASKQIRAEAVKYAVKQEVWRSIWLGQDPMISKALLVETLNGEEETPIPALFFGKSLIAEDGVTVETMTRCSYKKAE